MLFLSSCVLLLVDSVTDGGRCAWRVMRTYVSPISACILYLVVVWSCIILRNTNYYYTVCILLYCRLGFRCFGSQIFVYRRSWEIGLMRNNLNRNPMHPLTLRVRKRIGQVCVCVCNEAPRGQDIHNNNSNIMIAVSTVCVTYRENPDFDTPLSPLSVFFFYFGALWRSSFSQTNTSKYMIPRCTCTIVPSVLYEASLSTSPVLILLFLFCFPLCFSYATLRFFPPALPNDFTNLLRVPTFRFLLARGIWLVVLLYVCMFLWPVAVVVYQHVKTCEWKRRVSEDIEASMASAAAARASTSRHRQQVMM